MITNLSYILAVAKHGSITKAAEELYISQPALSASIIRLENNLNIKLFERTGSGLSLTKAGECVARYSAEICLTYERMLNDLTLLKAPSYGALRIGAGMRHAVHIVDGFLFQYPTENVLLTQYSSYYDLKRALLSHEIDLCISAPPVDGSCITSKKFCTERLCVAFGKRHPFAERKEIFLNDLMDSSLLALPNGFSLRVVIDDIFQRAGLSPNYTIQAENNALVDLLHESKSVSYVAIYPVSRCRELNSVHPDICYRPLAGDITRTISASWLNKTPITPQFELILQFISEYYADEKYSIEP